MARAALLLLDTVPLRHQRLIAQSIQTALQGAQDLGLQEAEATGLEALLVLNYHPDRD